MISVEMTLMAIGGMTVVTYFTRIGGIWAMAFVPMSPRVEAMLRALSGSVLVALVLPAAINGGYVFQVAAVAAAAITAWTRRSLLAMGCAIALAAVIRALGGVF